PVVVAATSEEPQQFLNDAAQMHLFGGHEREAFVQVEAHLVAEHAARTGTGSVCLGDTGGVHMAHEVFVLGADRMHA
ncbi:MAG: hypothetical protein RIR09_1691, partial [Pseudomonadota bacterium]